MLEGIITKVLNKVLGDFIENIDSNDLSFSLLRGDVQLENVNVKKTLFDNIALPFKLHYGRVGKIHVDVPVTSIFSKPLKVVISDIMVILK